MTNFIQEIKNHNINKVLNLEMVFRTSDEDFNKSIDEVADTLNKSFLDGLVDEQAVEIDFKNLDTILEKARPHKYYKREGSPGNYKYYYTKEEYEKKKKKVEGGEEGLRINESQRKTVVNKPAGSTHEHNGKKYKKQGNGKWLEVSEQGMTKKEHYDKVQYFSERLDSMRVGYNSKEGKIYQKNLKDNHEQYKKLSGKEYDDTDFEEKKEGGKEKGTKSVVEKYAQKVKETIKTGNYYFDVQFCHPERVKESALEHAANTAEEYFSNITDEEIEKYTSESIENFGEETNISNILTYIADRNCDHSGYETITCVVIAEEE